MSDRRAELEAALRDHWNADDLAVYADELLAAGDPHGELIAIDLAPEQTASLLARRRALLATWIGKKLAAAAGDRIHRGFLDRLDNTTLHGHEDDRYAQLLASPAGRYVRAFHVSGSVAIVRAALKRLSWQPRPWLGKLVITVTGSEGFANAKLVTEVIAATPWLAELELTGRRVMTGFPHPRLRRLRVSGCDAIGTLGGLSREALPAVTHLDLAMGAGDGDHGSAKRTAVLALEQLPAVTHLDLSRNEPGNRGPHHLAGGLDVFELLREASVRTRLTHLRVPALRTRAAIEALLEAMDDMPALVEVTVARSYRELVLPYELARHRIPVKLGYALPWPDRENRDERDMLTITYPSRQVATLRLGAIYELLDQSWASLPPAVRAAWSEVLGFIDELHWLDQRGAPIGRPFPTRVLERAFERLRDVEPWAVEYRRLSTTQTDTITLAWWYRPAADDWPADDDW